MTRVASPEVKQGFAAFLGRAFNSRIGRHWISSMRRGTFVIITSVRARTSNRRWSFNDCWPRPVLAVSDDLVSPDARGLEVAADWGTLKSPENYVGYARTQSFASPGGATMDKPRIYALPARLRLNEWALSGDWTMKSEAVVLNKPNGRIAYRFHARSSSRHGPGGARIVRAISRADRRAAAGGGARR